MSAAIILLDTFYCVTQTETEEATQTGEATDVQILERETPQRQSTLGGDYRVILYNDDWHDFEEVVLQLQKATGCDEDEAERITYEVDEKGRAVCFRGERSECHRVARILREIKLQVEVDCD